MNEPKSNELLYVVECVLQIEKGEKTFTHLLIKKKG